MWIKHKSPLNATTLLVFVLGAAGKKNRQKERRLMKGFNLAQASAGAAGAVGGGRGPTTPGSAGTCNKITLA